MTTTRARATLISFIVFLALYGLAASLYPGGSKMDKTTPGFDWVHNYWCDLLNDFAHNGASNPAKPVAIAAMLVLATGLGILWYDLPDYLQSSRTNARLMRFSGIGSMSVAVFLFTPWHNAVVNVAGLLMAGAFLVTFYELRRAGHTGLVAGGVFCLLLWCGTYFIYQTNIFLPALALAQKIALAACLV
ncbi:MAG: hypothetical protein WCR52_23680 [Bacteroidota bacterium]